MASLKLSKILSGICIHEPRVTLEGSQVSFEKTCILQFSPDWQCPKLTLFSQKVWPLQTSELANSCTKLVRWAKHHLPPLPQESNWIVFGQYIVSIPVWPAVCCLKDSRLLFHLGFACGRLWYWYVDRTNTHSREYIQFLKLSLAWQDVRHQSKRKKELSWTVLSSYAMGGNLVKYLYFNSWLVPTTKTCTVTAGPCICIIPMQELLATWAVKH